MPVRVLIVDDSGFFRHRISDLLSGDSRIEVVGTAQNGKEAVEQAKNYVLVLLPWTLKCLR